ncbi:hypothetical protein V8C44DRAFT_21016 [Trichoderma aethiopicum]
MQLQLPPASELDEWMGRRQRPTSSCCSGRVSHLPRRQTRSCRSDALSEEGRRSQSRQRAGFCLALTDLMARSSVMQRHLAWTLARWLFFRRPTLQEPTSLAVLPLGVPASYCPGRTTWGIKHGRIASPASCAALGEMALTRASVDDQRLVQDLFLTSPDRTSSSGSRCQRHTFIGHHETSSLQKYEYY